MYYTSIGAETSQAIDLLIAQVRGAYNKALPSPERLALLDDTDPRKNQAGQLQHTFKPLIDKWAERGLKAKTNPAGFDAQKWAEQGNMFIKTIEEITGITSSAVPTQVLIDTIKATASDIAELPKKTFKVWPFLVGGAFLYVLVNAIFSDRDS